MTLKTFIFLLFYLTLLPVSQAWGEIFRSGDLIATSYGKTYVVKKVLGKGDFGTVYQVIDYETANYHSAELLELNSTPTPQDQKNGKALALKVIHNDFYHPDTFSEFHKKYKYLANIVSKNPDLAKVYSHGYLLLNGKTIKNSAVIEMELLEGADLHSSPHALEWTTKLGEEDGQLVLKRLEEFVDFGVRAIQNLSENRIVHSDLGPKNIILTSLGEFKLIDFDFVDIPGSETYSYDPAFSPPEVLNDQLVPGASDFYSLGMMVARFLTGTPPIISYKNSFPVDFELYAMADADDFDEDESFFNRIQGSRAHHRAMIEHLSKKFEERSARITLPQIRSKYMALAKLSLQLAKYNPAERGFSWRGHRYSYRGTLLNQGFLTVSAVLPANKCSQSLQ